MKTKICTACGKTKPLDAENWRRDRTKPDGFYVQCKPCSKLSVLAHRRRWRPGDVKERGEVGVRCLLWAPACGECEDIQTCWRLEEDGEDDPEPLEQ